EADLLLHVVDISHPNFEDHINSVHQTLDEIDGRDKPIIMVFNKVDAYEPEKIDKDDLITEKTEAHYSLEDWKNTWMNRLNGEAVFISATEKTNLEEFRKKVYEKVREIHVQRFPYNNFLYPDYTEEM
ncbi:MAG: GTPase HflX, partial [Flavobacteriaceae bacterium]|nr:GTPase HflX [Flavobacteriaceae bacterium]